MQVDSVMQVERDEAIKLLIDAIIKRDYPEGTTYEVNGEPSPNRVHIKVIPPPVNIDISINWSLIPTGEDPDDYK